MKLITPVRKFNTGRHYAANGQEIVYAVVQNGDFHKVVAFNDRSRGISGVIELHFGNMDLVTDAWVLRAYDDFHYHYGFAFTDFLREQSKDI